MRLELSDDEIVELRDLVNWYLGDLSAEIADTDNPAFRRRLRDRQDLLLRVRTALTPADCRET
jgi:hypothetical protein